MDQQKSKDETDKNIVGMNHNELHIPRTIEDNKMYTDLVHAGFRPPQVLKSERAMKHRRRPNVELSTDDEDQNHDSDVGQLLPHVDNTLLTKNAGDDIISDEDTKPRAIDLKTDKLAPAVVLHRQKKLKSTSKRKNDKEQSGEQKPLELFHRLFEPPEGRKKRKRIIIEPDDKTSKITTNRNQKQNDTTTTAKINGDEDSGKDKNIPAIPLKSPVVVELAQNAIIRGSITHKVLQKLNLLDANLVHDDPFPSENKDSHEMGSSNNNQKEPPAGDTVSVNEKRRERTSLKQNGDSATNDPRIRATRMAQVTESVCLRSTVLPQMTTRPLSPSLHVVILYGTYKGRTGYIVDEIDEVGGRCFVIKSDDPNDIRNGVTWTVSNTYVSSVAEFLTDQQETEQISNAAASLPNAPRENLSITGRATPANQRKHYDLFLSCLRTELAMDDSNNDGHENNKVP